MVDDFSILEDTVLELEEQAVDLRQESAAEGHLAEGHPIPYLSWSEILNNLQRRKYLELGFSTKDERGNPEEWPQGDCC